jgi:asparagine synthase (glutamine-hydrolysing)
MCGIVGFLKRDGGEASSLAEPVQGMANTLVHRGPDDAGYYLDPPAGLALGFRRLAIIDLTPSGHQPMVSSNDRYAIVFNGEIYNFRELRSELGSLGHSFRSSSDTEVILAAASQWGFTEAIPRLWGMFAIAMWDREERTLWLARDRLGKKPLYYGRFGGTFMFASELKALHAHPQFRAALDHKALAAYVRLGYVPSPSSIFQGVNKLPVASIARVRAGDSPNVSSFWKAADFFGSAGDSLDLDDREAIDYLESLLGDAVARRMISDVPLGAMLSGGIDSSVVVAMMQEATTRPVKTFTIGYHHAEHDESASARAVASHLGTDHSELFVTPEEARAVIPQLPNLYDEPFADSSQIPTFLVSRFTREHVTVSLSGDGGDELFGGYTRYNWAAGAWSKLQRCPPAARQWVAEKVLRIGPATLDHLYDSLEWALPGRYRLRFAGDKLHKFAEIAGARDAVAFYRGVVSIWKNPLGILRDRSLDEDSLTLSNPPPTSRNGSFTEYMMHADLLNYLPDDILVKVDRASMGASLEARAPLLDHRLVEWVSRLPMRFKIRGGISKWILRQVLYRRVPYDLIERPKMGFGVPIGIWLKGPLKEWAEDLLSEPALLSSNVMDVAPIREAWAEHLSGKRNHEYRLWVVLMFQAWRRRWSL